MTAPESFGASRRSVTVVLENVTGSEQFVLDEVIPAINAAVGEDHVVMATHSQSASEVNPGRFQAPVFRRRKKGRRRYLGGIVGPRDR